MGLPTPRSKSAKRRDDPLPRAHVKFWRAFPNKESYPVDPEGRHLFIYNLEQAGTGPSTMGYYMRKGYRPVELSINMPGNKKGPIIEGIQDQLGQVIEANLPIYNKAKKDFKPEMVQDILDEKELERRDNMNAILRNTAAQERKKMEVAKPGSGGSTVAEVAGIV